MHLRWERCNYWKQCLCLFLVIDLMPTAACILCHDRNMSCQWTFKASSPGHVVKLVVLDSLLEASSTCRHDYLIAYDGRLPNTSNCSTSRTLSGVHLICDPEKLIKVNVLDFLAFLNSPAVGVVTLLWRQDKKLSPRQAWNPQPSVRMEEVVHHRGPWSPGRLSCFQGSVSSGRGCTFAFVRECAIWHAG